MKDEDILKLYAERSEQAPAETYAKYRGLLFSIAFEMLGSPEDAEECVNDVMLKAWNGIPPSPPSLPNYLKKLTRTTALDIYDRESAQKRGGGSKPLILDELAECLPANAEDVDMGILLRAVIGDFICSLPDEDARVFIARYKECLSVKEIADGFGMGESRIKMKLSRARKKLKKRLEKEGVKV